jgi:hypothetical protein
MQQVPSPGSSARPANPAKSCTRGVTAARQLSKPCLIARLIAGIEGRAGRSYEVDFRCDAQKLNHVETQRCGGLASPFGFVYKLSK